LCNTEGIITNWIRKIITMTFGEVPADNNFKPVIPPRGIYETLDSFEESPLGTHCLMVYPDLLTLRAIYSQYTKILLEEKNEIVLILPYYETTDMVRLVLSGANIYYNNSNNPFGYSGIDVSNMRKKALSYNNGLPKRIFSFRRTKQLP
jgi:hypothetical protein